MTTDVRTFRAADMQAALEIVRREMGHDAVVLHTRQIEKRRLLPFLSARQEVEITAGLGPQVRPANTAGRTIAAKAASTTDLAPPPPLLGGTRTTSSAESATPSLQALLEEAVRSLPQSSSKGTARESSPLRNTVVPPRWSPDDVIDDTPAARPAAAQRPAQAEALQKPSASTPRPVLRPTPVSELAAARPANASNTRPLAGRNGQTIAARSRLAEPSPIPLDTRELHQRLDTLQQMILDLGREREASLQEIPTELFPLYTQLIENEVPAEFARELIAKARSHATRSQLASPSALQALVTGLIEQELRIGSPIATPRGQRKVIALVGPTGVGKTTTLAKLAANLRLREGLKVGLITVDTYRIAAVEQLKTYAEIIDLPMQVVSSPADMQRALAELEKMDVVLIDTAGRSPRDELKIQELKECLDAAQADEVHLVLSLAAGVPALTTVAQHFKPVGVTSLILTKLDETLSNGSLIPIAQELRWPVSYLTTGQNVPDDIEPAHATRMARLVLGLDQIN